MACGRETPACFRCVEARTVCLYDSDKPNLQQFSSPKFEDQAVLCQMPTEEQYENAIAGYIDIYEIFPLLYPDVLNAIYTSATKHEEDEKVYLMAMVTAMSALISIYKDPRSVRMFYESAKNMVNTLNRRCVEGFISRCILVSCPFPKRVRG